MSQFFFILLIITLVGVLLTLMTGLFSMASGSDFNKKYGNKLMQLRVVLQGAAIILFVLAMATSG